MYRVIGIDGRQYGPVTADQLRRWIGENRANARTQVLPEGTMEWKLLGTLPEFAAIFGTGTTTLPPLTPASVSQPRVTNAYALWGMIFGILSLLGCFCCCWGVPLGALGLIFSLIGLSQINARPEMYEGRSLAIVGIVLSGASLLIALSVWIANLAGGHYHSHYYYNRYFRNP
jgi:polyferredoxin